LLRSMGSKDGVGVKRKREGLTGWGVFGGILEAASCSFSNLVAFKVWYGSHIRFWHDL